MRERENGIMALYGCGTSQVLSQGFYLNVYVYYTRYLWEAVPVLTVYK